MLRSVRSRLAFLAPAIAIAFILAIAAWLRLWQIGSIPPGFHFDEAFEGLEAWRILTDSSYRPIFLTGNFGVPPLNAYANAATFAVTRAFGGVEGPTAMRTTAAFFGILGVLVVYALGHELVHLDRGSRSISHRMPLLAAASLAVMRWHVHFSRMGIEPVIVPLIWALSLYLLLFGWRSGRWLAFVGSGVGAAASMYTYQGAWIIPFLLLISTGILFVDGRNGASVSIDRRRRQVWGALTAGLTALLLFLPLGFFFAQHPDLLLLRPGQLAIVGDTGSPADRSLWNNVWATAIMFVPLDGVGDMDPRRNLPGAPALSVWQAVPFFIGFALAILRIRRPAYSLVIIGFVGLLLPGVVSEYAPHFHRILGAAAPVALLCGVGLDWVWQRLRQAGRRTLADEQSRWGGYFATAIVVLLLGAGAVTTTHDYFRRWAVLPDLYYAFDEGLWEVGLWSEIQLKEGPVYITPRGVEHATLAFAWRDHLSQPQSLPVSFDGRLILPLNAGVTTTKETYTVIEHEDWRTPLLLPEVLPSVVELRTFDDRQGKIYARAYGRPSGTDSLGYPGVEFRHTLGDGITLLGYDVLPEVPRAGDSLYLRLHWLVEAMPTHDWTVFSHVVDLQTGELAAGHDAIPGAGSLPTQRWRSGWRIVDEYEIPLPDDLSAGTYGLQIGLYDGDASLPANGRGLTLGKVTVE